MTRIPLPMKRTLLTLALAIGLIPLPAEAKDARCVIKQNGTVAYKGVCYFHQGKGGSFNVHLHDGKQILPNITDISVSVVSTGVAEVRGLTTDGINSRWGSAVRSKTDPACWTGSDFEICAY